VYENVKSQEITCLESRDLLYQPNIDTNLFMSIIQDYQKRQCHDDGFFKDDSAKKLVFGIMLRQLVKNFQVIAQSLQEAALAQLTEKVVEKIAEDQWLSRTLFVKLLSRRF